MTRLLSISMLVLLLSVFAQAGTATTEGGVLKVPQTYAVVAIDGELDAVWKNVTPTAMRVMEDGSDSTFVGTYYDHFATFRVMWSEDYLYLFVSVVDDSLDNSVSDPWNRDNIEIFIDGNNSKNDAIAGYDSNDVQWRWVYDSDDDTSQAGGPGEFVFTETEEGYNFEVAIDIDTLEALDLLLEEDEIFGFEIANRDMDSGAAETNIKWWNNGNVAWNTPSIFGTAQLVGREVSTVLDIPLMDDYPEIDGIIDGDFAWLGVPEIGLTTIENGALEDTILTDWDDHFSTFRMGYTDEGLYVFVEVIDDSLDNSVSDPWNRDNIEIFIDGNNSKNDAIAGYDSNDVQWRWVYDSDDDTSQAAGPGDFVFTETEVGYNLEIEIGIDTLAALDVLLVGGETIGFEIANRDMDSQVAQINRKWWNTSGVAWNTPSVFGTAEFQGDGPVSIDATAQKPNGFNLDQNFPNPFNPATRIDWNLDKSAMVTLEVHNVLGQKVATLVNGMRHAGADFAVFNGAGLTSGVYFYKLTVGENSKTKKMMLIK